MFQDRSELTQWYRARTAGAKPALRKTMIVALARKLRHLCRHTHQKGVQRRACRRAGITDFHPHDCRHTWAKWHYQENRDLTALQALGGWLTLKMVMRYAHANKSEFRASIDRLPGKAGEI
jgi:integrase